MGWQDDTVVAAAEPTAPVAPPWARDEVHGSPASNVARRASGPLEAIQAGYQGSATGLIARNRLPDIVLDPHNAKWYEKALASASQLVSEIPEMIAGAAIGAPAGAAAGGAVGSVVPIVGTAAGAAAGGVVGTGAGAFAVPAAIREAYTQALSKGEVTSAGDFLQRALIVLKTTAKEGAVGGLTFGAGGLAARTVGKAIAPAVGESLSVPAATGIIGGAETAAQYATMVVAPAALEGHLPEPEDWLNAAIVLVGAKAAVGAAGKLRTLYEKTGVTPDQVVTDSTRTPTIQEDLKAPGTEIPRAYQPAAAAENARNAVPEPGPEAKAFVAQPFSDVRNAPGEPVLKTHVNYNYINSTEDAAGALSRLSGLYEQQVRTATRGEVPWEKTYEDARKAYQETTGETVEQATVGLPGETYAKLSADLYAKKELLTSAAEELMRKQQELAAMGDAAPVEAKLALLAQVERTGVALASTRGAQAEVGRALNILKSTNRDKAYYDSLNEVFAKYGGEQNIGTLVKMLGQVGTPEGALAFAGKAAKATTWEKVVEAWKASILSGPTTHMANVLGNTAFAAMRAPIDALAAFIGVARGAAAADRVALMEPVGRITGLMQGTMDGLKVGWHVFRVGDQGGTGKGEQFRPAIEGKKGEIVRLPFRALSAEDAVFKTMSERGEAYTLAIRQATSDGLNPLTREYRERVADLVKNPTEDMQGQIEAAGKRFTFNTEFGEKGKSVQDFVKKWHLEMIVPFIRTPINIAQEMLRMTPFAPLVGKWQADFKAGGAARDKALAEITLGTGIMAVVGTLALDGTITGGGDPDAGKRNVKRSAGWQPYSVKVGDTYYSLNRLQPIGTLIGLAADMANVWDHMDEEERDKIPKIMATAFGNAITNQTFLQGLTAIVNVLSDPTRYGSRFFESYAGSLVPALVAQSVTMNDPYERHVEGMLDAIKSRLPGLRETLPPKRDVFGEPLPTKERLGVFSPVTESKESPDKVRQEAARLDVSVAQTPKKTHLGRATGKIGDVKLSPEQQDIFASVGGKLAHEVMSGVVNSPGWDNLPDLVQKRAFEKAFAQAHHVAALSVLTPEERDTQMKRITERMQVELAPPEEQ